MHLFKNISERIVKLLSGLTDTLKVRSDEKERKRFRTSWPKTNEDGNTTVIPPAPFSFSKDQLSVANQRSMNVKAPSGLDWRPLKIFGKDSARLKSNEWKHVLTSGILKFCIRGLLGKDQEGTLTELCDVVSLLCAEEILQENMDGLEYRVHRALSLMERDFPASIHVITFHLLHHLPKFIQRFGPVYEFWMYPMERFNNWIKQRVLNRYHPEATVLETYRLYELSFHLQLTDQLPFGATIDITAYTESTQSDQLDLEDDGQQSSSHCQGYQTVLGLQHIQELNRLYICTYPECRNAAEQQEKEPGHGLTSTGASSSNCVELSEKITQYKVYTHKGQHNQSIKFGSVLSEHDNMVRISSYVRLSKTSCSFGRIQFIFEHHFHKTHKLVCVHWYDDATTDPRSGLKYVDTRTKNVSLSSIVYLNDISKPLVHAKDEIKPHKLWILNDAP